MTYVRSARGRRRVMDIYCDNCKYYSSSLGDYGVGEWCDCPEVKVNEPHTVMGDYDPAIVNKNHDCEYHERELDILEKIQCGWKRFWKEKGDEQDRR